MFRSNRIQRILHHLNTPLLAPTSHRGGGGFFLCPTSPLLQSSPTLSSPTIKTAAIEAKEVEARCVGLRERLAALKKECDELRDRLERSAEEKARMEAAARTAMGGAGGGEEGSEGEGGDVFAENSAAAMRRGGGGGGGKDEGFLVDPRKVAKVHASRSSGTLQQLYALTAVAEEETAKVSSSSASDSSEKPLSNAAASGKPPSDDTVAVGSAPSSSSSAHSSRPSSIKGPIGQNNTIIIVGTVIEDPVYGVVGGMQKEMGKKKAGASDKLRVIRTATTTTVAEQQLNADDAKKAATEATTADAPATSPSSSSPSTSEFYAPISELLAQCPSAPADPIPVLQLVVQQLGSRATGSPGPSRDFKNTFVVQCRGEYAGLAVVKGGAGYDPSLPPPPSSVIGVGSRIVVIGHYSVHAVFQLDTTQWQLNPTIDVGPSGYIGVL